jgi:hypothetical protein
VAVLIDDVELAIHSRMSRVLDLQEQDTSLQSDTAEEIVVAKGILVLNQGGLKSWPRGAEILKDCDCYFLDV